MDYVMISSLERKITQFQRSADASMWTMRTMHGGALTLANGVVLGFDALYRHVDV